MNQTVQALVTPQEFQRVRAHLFPSIESLNWWIRTRRADLVEWGAVLKVAGRVFVSPERFDAAILEVGTRDAAKIATETGGLPR